jgi:hypothetical protein
MNLTETLARVRQHDTPQQTLRMIASWAENSADLYDDIDSEYDPGSEAAERMRILIRECNAVIFMCLTTGHPQARHDLARGLDIAQRIVGPGEEHEGLIPTQGGA